MNTLTKLIEKYLLPVASMVARNKYLQTIAQTFTSLLPVIIIGSFALIFSRPVIRVDAFTEGTAMYDFFVAWQAFCDVYGVPLRFLSSASLGSLSLWVTIGISNSWANKYEMNNFRTVIVAIVSFLMVNSERLDGAISTKYFGGEGLFSAILVAFIASQMFRYLTKKGLGAIEFPDSVPASLKNSISALLPMAIVVLSFTLLGGIFSIGIGKSFPAFILSICEPLNFAVNSIWGIALVSTLGQIAWWFGIHNMAIVSVVLPILYSNLAANADAYAAGVVGTNLPFIVNTAFFYTFCTIGGSGATLALAILLFRSKSVQMRTVGKLSIIPAYFGINEPVIFGLPIMLNPILLLPFIFVQIVNIIITYMVMAAGLVGRPIFYLGANAPSLFGQFLSTMDWRAPVLWIILLLIDIVLWYPFFRIAEREKLEEESGKEQPGEELQANVL